MIHILPFILHTIDHQELAKEWKAIANLAADDEALEGR